MLAITQLYIKYNVELNWTDFFVQENLEYPPESRLCNPADRQKRTNLFCLAKASHAK
jgi:hypothetical protein